ncbi:hypothetical protein D3C76_472010 [compost metagenome]
MSDAPEHDEPLAGLAEIEFQSPGRFAVHNPESELPAPQPWEPAAIVLGSDDTVQPFDHPDSARSHALSLMQQARRTLCLYTPDMELWLYHHSCIQEACTRFLLEHPRNQLRILTRETSRAIKEGHRLLNLSRRLSSNFQIRRINPNYPNEVCAFLLADTAGMLVRPEPQKPVGYVCYNAPRKVRQLQALFDQSWNTSLGDPNLRSFLL